MLRNKELYLGVRGNKVVFIARSEMLNALIIDWYLFRHSYRYKRLIKKPQK